MAPRIVRYDHSHKSTSPQSTSSSPSSRVHIYDDVLLDTHLSAVIEKRITAITNSKIVYKDNAGNPDQSVAQFISGPWFSRFITDVLMTRFWGHSLFEFVFEKDRISYYLIPRRHVIPETRTVVLNPGETSGINYSESPYTDYCIEAGDAKSLGILLNASPIIIYKRNSMSDWAQFCEIFGMPFRVGKYDTFDENGRQNLESAMQVMGSAFYAVIPKDTDIEIMQTTSYVGTQVYKEFVDHMNTEISKLILGNTLTTEQGDRGARSLGEVHRDVEDQIHLADQAYVIDLLNNEFRALIEKHGYRLSQGGAFSFSHETVIPLTERIDMDLKIHSVAPIDKEYFYKTYGVPPAPDNQTNTAQNDSHAQAESNAQAFRPGTSKKGFFSFFHDVP